MFKLTVTPVFKSLVIRTCEGTWDELFDLYQEAARTHMFLGIPIESVTLTLV